ncbi:DUF1553 domain-containing protein [Lewinella sp. 4G2]|uniref:DUF1553 domain-containing protein n=1 Tax=Lewinella sp. 4G2 TaxID=1803372 RepID=UPI0007B4A1C2|nr:DUF1553 domain-containing protein [Lewinella sp. 4G2]OAV43335.1 hypothetical protein A3850_001970 [Lewinella sp. 4G2]
MRFPSPQIWGLLLLLTLTACGPNLPTEVQTAMATLPETVDFNQHIRPILSDRCWSCHGPDAGSRQADLRLDLEENAFGPLASGNGYAFRAGSPAKSEALLRMISDDPDVVMPTPESHMTMEPREIALFNKWIEQGAEWKDHWAFLPIADPDVPANPEGMAAAGSIDHFINERLRQEGLSPNGRTDDERLVRRVYLDLTGLPPSPRQMDHWLKDPSDTHYARLVDSLLSTSASAERLTMEWLDLARYADSHGMHADGARLSYPYRDWIIEAFRQNRPFNEFVTEQLAGDLFEDPTQDQLIASAFNRMHPQTAEGGAIDEEMRLTYVFDRVNTVATGLLGLTMDCSRCHDHKFDPLSQSEYYGFSAFFNNFNELGMTADDGDFGPTILLMSDSTRQLLDGLDANIEQLNAKRRAVAISGDELQAFLANPRVSAPRPTHHVSFDAATERDGKKQLQASAWGTPEIEIVTDSDRGRVIEFDHPYDDVYFPQGIGQYHINEAFTNAVWVKTTKRDSSLTQTIVGNANDKAQIWKGYDLALDGENRLNLTLTHALPNELIHVRTIDSLEVGRWYHVAITYDGTGRAAGATLYVDGVAPEQETLFDFLRGNFYPDFKGQEWRGFAVWPLRVGQSHRTQSGENGVFLGYMDDLKLYDRALTPAEIWRVAEREEAIPANAAESHLLKTKSAYAAAQKDLRDMARRKYGTQDTLPRFMVSQETPGIRKTYRLDRGAYDAPAEEVFPTTPASVLPFSENLPKNRLGLAAWIFDDANPLTARVAVNRYWQLIFGRGLISTPHDLGSQGALPSHPQLLDHLATEFKKDWDVRALIRTMVLSETYRRDSRMPAELRDQDAENIYLAAGPSGRLPAEMIRDNALAASGLLDGRVGGPSVKPYQPPGLWIQSLNFSQDLLHFKQDHGNDLYRRSMYTFIRRTQPPPFVTNFDATGRDVCIVERSKTNTPLQALNLLNDPQFVEAARVLAQRVQGESSQTDEQLAQAFRLVTGRRAGPGEVDILRDLYRDELERFERTPAAADSLLAIGEFALPERLDRSRTAALTSVGNILFSFDEAYVKR